MRSALGSGCPVPAARSPSQLAQACLRNLGAYTLTATSTERVFSCLCPLPQVRPWKAPGWVEACCSLCSSFWKNLSSQGDLDVRTTCFVPKAKIFCRRRPGGRLAGEATACCCPLSAGYRVRNGAAPQVGGRAAGAEPDPGVPLAHGPSLCALLPPSLAPASWFGLASSPALSWQTEPPQGRISIEQSLPPECSSCCWASSSSTSPCWCSCLSPPSSA